MKLRIYRNRMLSGNVARGCGLTDAEKKKIGSAADVIAGIRADAEVEDDEPVRRRTRKVFDSLIELLRFCKQKRRR